MRGRSREGIENEKRDRESVVERKRAKGERKKERKKRL
jgi:hypothetical protein